MKLLPLLILFTTILFLSAESVAALRGSEKKRIKRQYYGYSYPSYQSYGYNYPSYQSGINPLGLLRRAASMSFFPSGGWWGRNRNGK
ncbi:hypothetical protein RB195_020449 [Necator americanus]|uniref:Uncharacterized protein n=1 Tax=Necator americanus TaxID=51031 RepID=A0ABR1CKP2_NECAM